MIRAITAGAAVVSVVGVAMSVAAALDRAAAPLDRALIGAVAVCVTLACHLLPAISRTMLARALWACCLLLTAWGHVAFFTGAAGRAAAVRSGAVSSTSASEALAAQLTSIQARPAAVVAAELARVQQRNTPSAAARASALTIELEQAREAGALRARITAAAEQHDQAREAASEDPAARTLAGITGLPANSLTAGASVLSAVLVELLAALLWCEALRRPEAGAAAKHKPWGSSAAPKSLVWIGRIMAGARRAAAGAAAPPARASPRAPARSAG